MGEGRLQIDEIQKLRQRERDHRKIDALAPDGDKAGDDAESGGCRGTDQNSELRRDTPDLQGVGADVACGPQKHRVAERQQSAIADQEVEGAGEQRKAQRLHHKERIDAGPGHDQEQRRHDAERDHLIADGARVGRQRIVGGDCHVRSPAPSVPKASPAAPAP